MLATGSADTTVRVWDVGEDFMPHADEWARVKNRTLYPKTPEVNATGDDSKRTRDIIEIENTVVGDGVKHDITAGRSGKTDEGGKPEAGADFTAAASNAVSTEKAHNALRAMRPELLRQAGACAVWRTGRITAVLDRAGCSSRRRFPPGASGAKKNAQQQPIVEVRYSSGIAFAAFLLFLKRKGSERGDPTNIGKARIFVLFRYHWSLSALPSEGRRRCNTRSLIYPFRVLPFEDAYMLCFLSVTILSLNSPGQRRTYAKRRRVAL